MVARPFPRGIRRSKTPTFRLDLQRLRPPRSGIPPQRRRAGSGAFAATPGPDRGCPGSDSFFGAAGIAPRCPRRRPRPAQLWRVVASEYSRSGNPMGRFVPCALCRPPSRGGQQRFVPRGDQPDRPNSAHPVGDDDQFSNGPAVKFLRGSKQSCGCRLERALQIFGNQMGQGDQQRTDRSLGAGDYESRSVERQRTILLRLRGNPVGQRGGTQYPRPDGQYHRGSRAGASGYLGPLVEAGSLSISNPMPRPEIDRSERRGRAIDLRRGLATAATFDHEPARGNFRRKT